MQPASEKCSYLEEFSCKEDSLKENRFCFNKNQDTTIEFFFNCLIHSTRALHLPLDITLSSICYVQVVCSRTVFLHVFGLNVTLCCLHRLKKNYAIFKSLYHSLENLFTNFLYLFWFLLQANNLDYSEAEGAGLQQWDWDSYTLLPLAT